METHEAYVSLETAKLLKQAGFDWEVDVRYKKGEWTPYELSLYRGDSYNYNYYDSEYSAPTLAVAQKWLREVKKYHIYVRPYSLDDETYVTNIVVIDSIWGALQDDNKKAIIFKTYEQALEAGIKKCLTIIL